MLKKYQVEEIKRILDSEFKFDLKLVAFEYGIDVDEVLRIKAELEQEKSQPKARKIQEKGKNSEILEQREIEAISKIKLLRRNYKSLCSEKRVEYKVVKEDSQNDKEKEYIDFVVNKAEEAIENCSDAPKVERNKMTNTIINEVRKILSFRCELTINQAFRLWNVLNNQALEGITLGYDDKTKIVLKWAKGQISKKLCDAIETEYWKAQTVEDFEKLSKFITFEMQKQDQLGLGSLRNKIDRKITELRLKALKEKNENPQELLDIATKIANGTINIDEANLAIESYTKKKMQESSKRKINLSIEEQRQLVINHIGRILENKADTYPIKDPVKAIEQLQSLKGVNNSQAIMLVMKHLVERGDYKIAKKIFETLCEQDSGIRKTTYPIEYIIRNAEITDIVKTLLNSDRLGKEEYALYNLLEIGIRRKSINLKSINLGKRGNGIGSITLADIWKEEQQR